MASFFNLTLNDQTQLRLLEDRHADELFALVELNRAYLREWMPWLDTNTSVINTRSYISAGLAQFAQNNGFVAGIWHKNNLAGTIGHHNIVWHNRSTTMGYWLSAPCQGKGLMTQACRALVAYSFEELGLNRVEIRCAPGNKKSRAIPERLGFTQEGTLRQAEWLYDHYVDNVVYGMLVSEWQPRPSK